MSVERSYQLVVDPAWPFNHSIWGLPTFALTAALIVALTVWTYIGTGVARRRLLIVLGLRLAALLVAFLAILRPSVAVSIEEKVPSVLLIACDDSESMNIEDEAGSRSRWEVLQRTLQRAEPALERLKAEQNVTVLLYRFSEGVADYDPAGKAQGKRTDFAKMLSVLYDRHKAEQAVRGLIVLSDGADNGREPPLEKASAWRGLAPIHTFVFGQTTTGASMRDIALTSINPEPTTVPIKGKIIVRATIDAQGFENSRDVPLRLFFDDKEVAVQAITLPKSSGNDVQITADAPPTPGEIRVTLKVDPKLGETTKSNNQISSYITVTKEGLSVLVVDRLRLELKYLRQALAGEPRIRLYEAIVQTDEAPPGVSDRYGLDKQFYDVIILGDVSARRLEAGAPSVQQKISELVKSKGVGLMMMGGVDSFGGSPDVPDSGDWAGTPIAGLLPVELVRQQIDEPIAMMPTKAGLDHFIMRLDPNPKESEALWAKLNRIEPGRPKTLLNGMNQLGRVKPGATVLAVRDGARVRDEGMPILVGHEVGAGRVLAFAADSTYNWLGYELKSGEGAKLHARFWRNVVLWLARQEQTEGNVYVKPEIRRLNAGARQTFEVGMKGKTGLPILDARFSLLVTDPQGNQSTVEVARDRERFVGRFLKTDLAGEYRVEVRGTGKDTDGSTIDATASARFMVYEDEAELLRQAANPEFLAQLAARTGGKALLAQDLPEFLAKLEANTQLANKFRPQYYPDWRRTTLSPFLPLLLICFVALIGTEWGLRRWWGMV
jgi:uncharacterized membrane protein